MILCGRTILINMMGMGRKFYRIDSRIMTIILLNYGNSGCIHIALTPRQYIKITTSESTQIIHH